MRFSRAFPLAGVAALVAFAAVAEVPVSRSVDGHDTIPVMIDGKGPFPFILDTGADGGAVYAWFAQQQGLRKTGRTGELTGQTGATPVALYELADVAVDGHRLRDVTVFRLPDRHDEGREAGILGNDFMDGVLVVFDFPCRTVALHDKPVDEDRIIGPGPDAVPAGLDEGSTLLTLPVTINGFTGPAVLDTGSRNSRLNSAFASAAGIDAKSAQFHDGEAVFGANSRAMVPRNGPLGHVGFAGVEIAGAEGQVIDLPMLEQDFGGKPAMLLGSDLLGGYRLLYDHQEHRIWIRPSRCQDRSRVR